MVFFRSSGPHIKEGFRMVAGQVCRFDRDQLRLTHSPQRHYQPPKRGNEQYE
jgi:hypothetical protein